MFKSFSLIFNKIPANCTFNFKTIYCFINLYDDIYLTSYIKSYIIIKYITSIYELL